MQVQGQVRGRGKGRVTVTEVTPVVVMPVLVRSAKFSAVPRSTDGRKGGEGGGGEGGGGEGGGEGLVAHVTGSNANNTQAARPRPGGDAISAARVGRRVS